MRKQVIFFNVFTDLLEVLKLVHLIESAMTRSKWQHLRFVKSKEVKFFWTSLDESALKENRVRSLVFLQQVTR